MILNFNLCEAVFNAGYSLLSEISLIRYRSPLATLNTNCINMGWLLGLCVGLVIPIHLHYPTLCLFSVIFLCLCWFLPESPVWLMRRGRESDARLTLRWLRGVNYDIEPEMEELKQIVAQEEDNVAGLSIINVITNKTFLKPLLLCCILFTLQALSGTVLISFYSAVIFKDVGVSSEHIALIYQVINNLIHQKKREIFTLDCDSCGLLHLSTPTVQTGLQAYQHHLLHFHEHLHAGPGSQLPLPIPWLLCVHPLSGGGGGLLWSRSWSCGLCPHGLAFPTKG